MTADRVLVGAPDDDDAENHAPPWANLGSASVFRRNGGTFVFEQRLWSPFQITSTGASVALSDDTAALGRTALSGRAVTLFNRSGTTWTHQQTIFDPDPGNSYFGSAIAVDGDTLVIGSREHDTSNCTGCGAAYIYFRSAGTWSLQQAYDYNIAGPAGVLGWSVALSGDTAAAGAPGDAARTAYVWARSGTAWSVQGIIVPVNGEMGDRFGGVMSLSGDTLAVAAENDSENGVAAGAVTIYTRTGATWSYQQKVVPSSPVVGLGFGRTLSVSGDRLIVGTGLTSRTYLFERNGGTWSEVQQLTPWGSTVGVGLWPVALAANTAVVGVPYDDAQATNSGAAYLFELGDPLMTGAPCGTDLACSTGNCVDGVCCSSACAGGALDCQACSIAAGAAVDGTCGPVSDGSACSDSLYCNGSESCTSGACGSSSGDPCLAFVGDLDNDCSESCNEASDSCTANDPDGAACNDGAFCNGTDSCNGGNCGVHANAPCAGNVGDADSDCSESCSESSDSCTANDPSGSACDDGIACNGTDKCSSGACTTHSTTCGSAGAGGGGAGGTSGGGAGGGAGTSGGGAGGASGGAGGTSGGGAGMSSGGAGGSAGSSGAGGTGGSGAVSGAGGTTGGTASAGTGGTLGGAGSSPGAGGASGGVAGESSEGGTGAVSAGGTLSESGAAGEGGFGESGAPSGAGGSGGRNGSSAGDGGTVGDAGTDGFAGDSTSDGGEPSAGARGGTSGANDGSGASGAGRDAPGGTSAGVGSRSGERGGCGCKMARSDPTLALSSGVLALLLAGVRRGRRRSYIARERPMW
jgi:hypothetical protein